MNTEVKNILPVEDNKSGKMLEAFGFIAIALTVVGQICVNITPLAGQAIWLVANALYLTKAIKQDMGKAEITRNVVMSALTLGLIVAILLGAF